MTKILLVDDHEIMRKGLKNLFSENKDWVICGEAANGQEAIERVKELKPDLVVLDVTMPVMNGLQAAEQIRKIAPKTKIVILSMHDSPHLKSEALKAGANACLVKSGPSSDLVATIAGLLA